MGGDEKLLIKHLNTSYNELLQVLDYNNEKYIHQKVSEEYIFAYEEFYSSKEFLHYSNVMAFGEDGNLIAYHFTSHEIKSVN